VLGAGRSRLDPAGVRRTFERHQRHGFTARGLPLLRAHGGRVHGCRVGVLMKTGFGAAVRAGPWHSLDRAG
jgi:hypothetical protein